MAVNFALYIFPLFIKDFHFCDKRSLGCPLVTHFMYESILILGRKEMDSVTG